MRDQERYHELFIKWAIRYLRLKGLDKSKYSGKVGGVEGSLLGPDGRSSGKRLVNVVANGREWIDEMIATELRISEGFFDITYDEERQEELGIEPELWEWWAQDEI